MLVEYFLREAATNAKRGLTPGIEVEALAALSSYTWPGNVRELQHIVERLVGSLTFNNKITAEAVHEALQELSVFAANPQVPMIFTEEDSLDEFLDRVVLGLYNHFKELTGGHAQAARRLRTDRNALYKRIERAREGVQGNGLSKGQNSSG